MMQPNENLERIKDSVMLRSMEGRIKFWNRGAEELYGWRKHDAVGKVSHELLRTQFPKPLKEIEAELTKKGRWEGRLVHATRDGRHVIVESRWSSDPTRQPPAVIEVNSRLTDESPNSEPQTVLDRTEVSKKTTPAADNIMRTKEELTSPGRLRGFLRTLILAVMCCVAFLWVFYGFFGRLGIRALHTNDSGQIADRLMAGRAFTPVENYYWHAEQLLWSGTLAIFAAGLIALLIIRNLGGTLLAGFSALITSLFLFSALEMSPHLIKILRVDAISPYFAYRANHIPDDVLIYTERPFNQGVATGFRGSNYSPVFGIDVVPWSVEWQTDENGFRNAGNTNAADIVVVGDSYMDYGSTFSDTFPSLLQEGLSNLTVVNLGKAGYGPFQYLEVFKRFGLKYKPRYALFAFYEGNDILDIQNYRYWKEGRTHDLRDITHIASHKSFLGRYWLALKTTAQQLNQAAFDWLQIGLGNNPLVEDERDKIHPDLAVIDLGHGRLHKIYIADHHTRSREALSEPENWAVLESILHEFSDISAAHHITPIVLYIPSASHIYAQFSTDASGGNWLAIREREIGVRKETENAVARLVQSAGVDFISLSPVLERGAREGELLYFQLDQHWNFAGTQLAAAYVADVLKNDFQVKAVTAH